MPRSVAYLRSSLRLWPALNQPLLGFTLRLPKKEVYLLVPARLLAPSEPLHQAPVFLWRQTRDRGFDFLDQVHTSSLAVCAIIPATGCRVTWPSNARCRRLNWQSGIGQVRDADHIRLRTDPP
jgi:hypothetical protein